ncbi:claspin isoform X2 [Amia ocellicauda]|uniref:claspin isoform X2 n=1 Tax=Amia ocellicauda TaxID=2972642 RepID=UPI0034648210
MIFKAVEVLSGDRQTATEESDVDSGKGSCGMGSPGWAEGGAVPVVSAEQQDSDEEVTVNRKSRCRKALRDSDSEAEEGVGLTGALVLSESSEEEQMQEGDVESPGKGVRRVARLALDSEDSETDRQPDGGQGEESPPREKGGEGARERKPQRSQRRREKAQKRVKAVERLKKRERGEQLSASLNDSGCLLGDSDLFDTGLGEEEEDEEESLEAIRAAVKKAVKKQKEQGEEEEEESKGDHRAGRKERKAARAGREALKQLHSESQRLVRESSLGLPYHLPEPKTIEQFFRRRAQPAGPAMALLKSTKYQPCSLAGTSHPQEDQNQPKQPQQPAVSDPEARQAEPEPHATSQNPTEELDPAGVHESPASVDQNQEELVTMSAVTEQRLLVWENSAEESSLGTEPVKEGPAAAQNQAGQELLEQQSLETGVEELGGRESMQATPLPPATTARKDRLARLREMGLDPLPMPRLCPDDGAFIQLEPPPVNLGLEKLKQRFLHHVQPPPRARSERSLQLSVLRKDTTPSGQLQLLTDTLTVTVTEGDEEVLTTKPGEKLLLLKSRLQLAMAQKRQEERQRRAALQRLDNEECEEEEEEEEEMTDESEGELLETGDAEGVEFLLGDGDGEQEEEEEGEGGDEVSSNAYAEGQRHPCLVPTAPSPPPYPLATEGTLLLFAGSSCSRTGEQTGDALRRAGPTGLEGDSKMVSEEDDSLPKDNSHNSSFELIGSMIPSYQPVNRAAGRGVSAGVFRSPSPGFYRPSFLSSTSKSSGKLSDPSLSLSLPVEDSQDLYAPPSPAEAGPGPLGAGDSQGRFSLEEDTHSQLLDADGFLNVGPRGAGPGQYRSLGQNHKRQLLLDSLDENAMDANMGELLGLCSGGFGTRHHSGPGHSGEPATTSQDSTVGELLGLCSGGFGTPDCATQRGRAEEAPPRDIPVLGRQEEPGSDTDRDELLALCSGKFMTPECSPSHSSSSASAQTETGPRDRMEQREEEEEQEEEDCEFHLLSDVGSLSDQEGSEEEEQAEEDDGENEGEEEEDEEEAMARRGVKRRMRLAQFLEEEAELSGSELGSEDEEDEGEGSEYEEEELQEELPSDEELQDQVNRIHMKQVLDDDKRRLRLYQERYLADGDLHSDGPGRARRFRWKNIDELLEAGLAGGDEQEEEEEEDLDEAEVQRRKNRLEREQWLREQSSSTEAQKEEEEEEEEDIGEESQFMKLAKKFTTKKLQQKEAPLVPKETKVPTQMPFQRPGQPCLVRRGSLLSQPRAVLQKLASLSDLAPGAPRSSRGFLFHTLTPEKEGGAERLAAQGKKRSKMHSGAPPAKKPCIEAPTASKLSIFRYLES